VTFSGTRRCLTEGASERVFMENQLPVNISTRFLLSTIFKKDFSILLKLLWKIEENTTSEGVCYRILRDIRPIF
jgi:hypothetical protein